MLSERILGVLGSPGGAPVVVVSDEDGDRVVARAVSSDSEPLRFALPRLLSRLRELTSREAMRALGLTVGLRMEDALVLEIRSSDEDGLPEARRWLARQVPSSVSLHTVSTQGPSELIGVFRERQGPPPALPEYQLQADGRLRVEAFELHVVEHCNLRCANCCNLSPFVSNRTLSVTEIAAQLEAMSRVLVADAFKIMGGEPLLHPDIAGVLRAVRSSGISQTVRLFTNGLLLPSMTESFWQALDQLTLSNYSSAPAKPHIIALAEDKAQEYGFIFNHKPVSSFSQVVSARYEKDDATTERIYRSCWLRHRCLIARGGRFYKCTRAAYAGDFHQRVNREPPPPGFSFADDGVDLSGPDLPRRLRDYLNSSTPLASCRYCLGGDGPQQRHHQLSRAEVSAGQLNRSSIPVA